MQLGWVHASCAAGNAVSMRSAHHEEHVVAVWFLPQEIGGTKCLVLQQDSSQGQISTVVLRGSTDQVGGGSCPLQCHAMPCAAMPYATTLCPSLCRSAAVLRQCHGGTCRAALDMPCHALSLPSTALPSAFSDAG